jgi:hypothetical protein
MFLKEFFTHMMSYVIKYKTNFNNFNCYEILRLQLMPKMVFRISIDNVLL